jgi:FtsP/CotA-like multicopper oxidase with cupredoxin domain
MKSAALTGAGLVVGRTLLNSGRALAVPPVGTPALTPYLDQMPILLDNAIDATGGGTVNLSTALITRKLHSQLPPTTLFGYLRPGGPGAGDTGASYLGPVIVAQSGIPVVATYTNNLASDAYRSVFTNNGSSYAQFNPFSPAETRILTHLHGAIDSGDSDGNPFASPDAYPSGAIQTATYPNEQAATLSWYHDHLLGDTRMNVVGGLAGGYLLRDAFDSGSNPLLPSGAFELPMVVQDRMFNPDGSLLYPVAPAATNGPWIGEYFGDVMMVNGKIWPTLTVQPAVYRFRLLNGCNARILSLRIARSNDQTIPMTIIGTEGGLLPLNPVAVTRMVLAPAERFDLICDFRNYAGQTLFMKNTNPPSPVTTPAPSLTTVMRFVVSSGTPTGSVPPTGSLRDPLVNDAVAALTALGPPLLSGGTKVPGRMITLNEIGAGTPAWRLNLNAGPYGGPDSVTETVKWNDVEDWYFVNFTADTHPMHTHLFSFRVMGRYNFDAKGYAAAFGKANGVPQKNVATLAPYLKSTLMPPDPTETGLKETVKANSGQVTVVRATFIPPSTAFVGGQLTEQKYVHHCHIVEHEDNDMMERVLVRP